MTNIPGTELDVFRINLGGNVLGWTADEAESFAVLDAYVAAGGNFVDTADAYAQWVPGNSGGESETIIGDWLAARGNRDDIVIATKVGGLNGAKGLSASNIRASAEASLKRLRVDHIDLYYAHYDDPEVPIEETLTAFDALVKEGKVRYIAASNFTPERVAESLAVSHRAGLAGYVALQPHYNLVERQRYETDFAGLAARENLGVLPYYALANGFLTGKYRTRDAGTDSPRAESALAYLDDRGHRVLAALDETARGHGTTVAAVALAWLMTRPNVIAPIASARTVDQLTGLMPAAELRLSEEDLRRLDEASS